MVRLTKMSGRWYSFEFEDLNDELENIEGFVNEDTPVLIATDLNSACDMLEIEVSEVEVVEPE